MSKINPYPKLAREIKRRVYASMLRGTINLLKTVVTGNMVIEDPINNLNHKELLQYKTARQEMVSAMKRLRSIQRSIEKSDPNNP